MKCPAEPTSKITKSDINLPLSRQKCLFKITSYHCLIIFNVIAYAHIHEQANFNKVFSLSFDLKKMNRVAAGDKRDYAHKSHWPKKLSFRSKLHVRWLVWQKSVHETRCGISFIPKHPIFPLQEIKNYDLHSLCVV